MSFARYLATRGLRAVAVVFGAATLIFFLVRVIPGDPARLALGAYATAAQVQNLDNQWGLNQPLYVQYLSFLKGLLDGNWGTSLVTRDPVLANIETFFPATLELTLFATVLTIIIGVPLGIVGATRRNKMADHTARVTSVAGLALPQFWVAIMLQLILGYYLRLLPEIGDLSLGLKPPDHITGLYLVDSLLTLNWPDFSSSFIHLLLPGFVLALGPIAQISRYLRSSMIDEMDKDYVQLARSYGLPNRIVNYSYMLKNALPAAMTQLSLIFGFSLGGAIIIEDVYSWPGMGKYLFEAISFKDLFAITGCVVVIAIAISLATFLNDMLNGFLDPRIRLGEKR